MRRTPRQSDTLPAKGRVTEVCKEWLVHEDGALAYQLQQEEVEQHYSGNKTRNAQVREDLPRAKEEQLREERDAFQQYQDMVQQQAKQDEYIAQQLAEKLQKEEEAMLRRRQLRDEEIARKIQEEEKMLLQKSHPNLAPINQVGLPILTQDQLSSNFRRLDLDAEEEDFDRNLSSMDFRVVLNDSELQEEAQRRLQEQKDEELARSLQEQYEAGSLSLEERDRLMAMEAQDKELARLLQEKDKARLRRARERAKQKALLKKQQQQEQQNLATESEQHNQETKDYVDPLNVGGSKKYAEEEKVTQISREQNGGRPNEENPSEPCCSNNIATFIDPTYSSMQRFNLESEKCVVPPYMPIQGQHRTSSLEKKSRKKEGCKQQ